MLFVFFFYLSAGNRVFLGFAGVLAAGLSIIASFGLVSACGMSFVSIVGNLPFLIIGKTSPYTLFFNIASVCIHFSYSFPQWVPWILKLQLYWLCRISVCGVWNQVGANQQTQLLQGLARTLILCMKRDKLPFFPKIYQINNWATVIDLARIGNYSAKATSDM